MMNSFSQGWAPPTGTETVEMVTVDEVMSEQEIEFVHFLKVDTEGHELEVLKAPAMRSVPLGLRSFKSRWE